MTFSDFKLNKQLLNAIEEAGYTTPTPIQKKAIPLVLAGHDIIGIAQTGTGKTAAFALPMLMKIKYAQGTQPRGLILAPTRELVMQIQEEVKKFSIYTDLRSVALYGGPSVRTQGEAISAGIDIVVATPQRFWDIYKQGYIDSRKIQMMVMDEADRMMDMGFMPQIRRILEIVPAKKRQNMLFSATMPAKVLALADEFLKFPERIEISPQATAATTVKQMRYAVPNIKSKINLLAYLLQDKEKFSRVMVFAKTKTTANNIYKFLVRKVDTDVRVIHANKDQNARINAMKDFKAGNIRILVTTDIAARGIDISMVTQVINFDVPHQSEDYVHRIGRTGRAEQLGEAITFFNIAEDPLIKSIEQLIREEIPVLPYPEEVPLEPTPFVEQQEMLRALDMRKQREDPEYKGAFHEKKKYVHKRPKPKAKIKGGGQSNKNRKHNRK
ncbi:MAG: DEAD/DEAH box helicase [Bernardetiaceae bacterium]|nr:DEAD/DEAH box helicase [Bernardetiaceae bacterium]